MESYLWFFWWWCGRFKLMTVFQLQVCVRCIFRLFGVSEYDDSCPLLKASTLLSLLKERRNIPNAISENGSIANGLTQCPYDPHASGNEQPYCSVCLGILQFTNGHDQDLRTCEGNSVSVLTSAITEILKKEAHQIDGFSIEISLPPVVSANDRAVWYHLYPLVIYLFIQDY